MVRVACKIFAGESHAAAHIGRLGDCLGEVEFTLVAARSGVRSVDDEVTHRLETGGTRANHVIIHNRFCGPVVPTEKSLAGFIDMRSRPRLVVISRGAIPYGTFVQEHHILCDSAINETAHVTVANRECVSKRFASILVVPQGQRIIRRSQGHWRKRCRRTGNST